MIAILVKGSHTRYVLLEVRGRRWTFGKEAGGSDSAQIDSPGLGIRGCAVGVTRRLGVE